MSGHLSMPSIVVVFLVLSALLVGVALFAVVWMRLGFGLLGLCLRGASRLGLYDPDERGTGGQGSERAIRSFTRALRTLSRPLPGRTGRHGHTIVVPLLLVGIPAFLALLLFLWTGPLLVFGYVLSAVPAPWSAALAFVSLFVYFEAMFLLWRLGRRLSTAVGTARARLG